MLAQNAACAAAPCVLLDKRCTGGPEATLLGSAVKLGVGKLFGLDVLPVVVGGQVWEEHTGRCGQSPSATHRRHIPHGIPAQVPCFGLASIPSTCTPYPES